MKVGEFWWAEEVDQFSGKQRDDPDETAWLFKIVLEERRGGKRWFLGRKCYPTSGNPVKVDARHPQVIWFDDRGREHSTEDFCLHLFDRAGAIERKVAHLHRKTTK